MKEMKFFWLPALLAILGMGAASCARNPGSGQQQEQTAMLEDTVHKSTLEEFQLTTNLHEQRLYAIYADSISEGKQVITAEAPTKLEEAKP